MKKFVFVLSFVTLFVIQNTVAQSEIGIIVSPALSVNRVTTDQGTYHVSSNGAKLKMSIGAFADIFLEENYYFSTGLILTPKSIGIRYIPTGATSEKTESYKTQYLQVPITLKLYTNEVALDKRVFVQFGLINEINIDKQIKKSEDQVLQNFRTFDFSVMIRSGLDFRLGYDTSIFAGISYTRGLVNAVSQYILPDETLKIKNDMISIDLGVRF